MKTADQKLTEERDELAGRFKRLAVLAEEKAAELKFRSRECNRLAYHWRRVAERLIRRNACANADT